MAKRVAGLTNRGRFESLCASLSMVFGYSNPGCFTRLYTKLAWVLTASAASYKP